MKVFGSEIQLNLYFIPPLPEFKQELSAVVEYTLLHGKHVCNKGGRHTLKNKAGGVQNGRPNGRRPLESKRTSHGTCPEASLHQLGRPNGKLYWKVEVECPKWTFMSCAS